MARFFLGGAIALPAPPPPNAPIGPGAQARWGPWGAKPFTNFFLVKWINPWTNFFFKSGQIYLKVAECAEIKEKLTFHFLNYCDMAVFVLIIGQFFMNFEYKIEHNSKNKNR